MNNPLFLKNDASHPKTLIVSFAGYSTTTPQLNFVKFFESTYGKNNTISRHYYLDRHHSCYHMGILENCKDVKSSVAYLQDEINKHPYENIIFIGMSAGGYASILFGSLLNIHNIIAFIPPTLLHSKNSRLNPEYKDILPFVIQNCLKSNKTHYWLYGSSSIRSIHDCHHISQCERLVNDQTREQIHICVKEHLNVKKMRDNGELLQIIEKCLM
jgi:hypothetical protein